MTKPEFKINKIILLMKVFELVLRMEKRFRGILKELRELSKFRLRSIGTNTEKLNAKGHTYFQQDVECKEESRLDRVYRRDLVKVSDPHGDGHRINRIR